ncbi:MAG: curved DNA-binding protein [Bacteroidia bacterium]|jgi:curved DNA-binding protein
MEFKDYYEILGVTPDADTADIKSAYRKLARKYHPDVSSETDAEDRFKEVAEAWEVLKDDERRAEFDELRRYGGTHQQQYEPPPNWQSTGGTESPQQSADFSDFFNSVFGGGFSQEGRGSSQSFGFRGQDIEFDLPIFLEETLADIKKPIEFELPIVEQGQVHRSKKSLNVTIPAGVRDGQRIRLRGQGSPGQGDAPAGDLYLNIRLAPHPVFDVDGRDLVVTVPIAPWEAALGAKVTVPTLDGKIKLSINSGSQSGQKLRAKGKGLSGKLGVGDLYAVLNVVMPTETQQDVTALWQELADKAAFNPRAQWEESS